MAEGGGPWRASIAAAVEAARHVFAAAAAAAAPAAAAGAAGAFVALLVSRLLSKPRRLLDLTAESSDGRHSHGPSAHGGNSYNEFGRLKVPRVMQQAQPLSPSKVQNSELVQKFVLTGGPCGGKTTALARLRQFLEDRGFRVFIAPEAATILWTNGMSVADMKSEADVLAFQIRLMQMQIFLEDCFCSLAERTGKKSVLLCDRGTMDGKAYCTPDTWQSVLSKQGFNETAIRDSRYNAVLHLTTAANGAEQFYTSENNITRSEMPEDARALDERLQLAWLGHPRHTVFINSKAGFEGKMASLIAEVSRLVGLPATGRKARKFLLNDMPSEQDFTNAGLPTETFTVEKCYPLDVSALVGADDDGGYTYVRRRANQEGIASYGETRVRIENGQTIEFKRMLTDREYALALSNADPSRHIMRTKRTNFNWGKLTVYIERYVTPYPNLCILFVQAEPQLIGVELKLPSFVEKLIVEEVTGNKEYSAYHLSRADPSTVPSRRGSR